MSNKHEWTMDEMYDQELAAGRTTMTRRQFNKYAGVTAAGFAMLGITMEQALAEEADDEELFADCDKFYAACSPECQHHNLCAYVKDGKVVKVGIGKNNESLPCMRGFARVDWLNTTDRLTKPLKRAGEKGEGKWEEIEWDEALDLLAGKIQEAIDTDGNQTLFFDNHAGNFHTLTGAIPTAFRARIGGTSSLTGTLCCAGMNGGLTPIWGMRYFDTRNTIAESNYIIVWGNNPIVSMGGYWERYEAARANGAKIVVIDPLKSESAAAADEWLPIKPCTDAALALGMLKVIVDEGLVNTDFLLAHTTAPCLVDAEGAMVLIDPEDPQSYAVLDANTGELVRHDDENACADLYAMTDEYTTVYNLTVAEAQAWTPEAVEATTGVPADKVVELALDYANAGGKGMLVLNMGGFMRNTYGSEAVATMVNLANFTGQVGGRGNGIYDAGGISNLVKTSAIWQNPPTVDGLLSVPRVKFAEKVLNDEVKCNVFVSYRESPMTQWPNTNAVKAMLKKVPFVCVIDNLMTSTALYADLVLPCAAVFESEDLLCSSRSHLIQLSEIAVPAPGEAHDDIWIFSRLAEKMGVGEDFQLTNADYIKKALEGTGYTYEQLAEEKAIDAMPPEFVPYEGGNFYTKTGKAEMYQPGWLGMGLPAVPTYIQCSETVGGDSGLDATYPLAAVQRKVMTSVHSTFTVLESMQAAGSCVAKAIVNTADAEARGIADGDAIVVFNDRGEHPCTAIVTDDILPGVVCLENGHWEQFGGSSSYVTNDAFGPIGTEHCCNETLVEVRPA